MKRTSDIRHRIRDGYSALPKNHQRIADFFLDNEDLIPFLSVHEIAKASSASVASIVRFSRRIGFSGYSDMRDTISQALQHKLKHEDVFPAVHPPATGDDTLSLVGHQDIKNIGDTLSLIKRDVFRRAVNIIQAAPQVHTVGLGISYLMANILAYQLNQVGKRAQAFHQGSTTFAEQILFAHKGDVLVGMSFPPYYQETVDVVRLAREKKLGIVAITNKSSAPIAMYADATLIVKSENVLFTNSFAAMAMLINAISSMRSTR
ncbi:MAG: MurR/RpiR family transcriptional regulator [Ignavibacteriales bacterium]|nr:MurR/RpiR family transcriptional regulator [Ignavibacteriales bacterium]